MANPKRDILKNIGEISPEDFLDDINEDDEILANAVEAEARLVQAFSNMMKEVKTLKYLLKPNMGVPYGSEEMDSMRDLMKGKMAVNATRERLKKVVAEKMPILHDIINDVLGPSEKEVEGKRETMGNRPHKKIVMVKNTDYEEDEEDEE